MKNHVLIAILCGGFVAGTVDVGAASLINWIDPMFILRVIASGAMGKVDAYAGGIQASMVGLILQWVMSWIIAAIYVIASIKIPSLRRNWVATSLAYGVVVFFVMNFIVVPHSRASLSGHFTVWSFSTNMMAMLVFGLIIGFFAQRYVGKTS